jgi:hypothetical protein
MSWNKRNQQVNSKWSRTCGARVHWIEVDSWNVSCDTTNTVKLFVFHRADPLASSKSESFLEAKNSVDILRHFAHHQVFYPEGPHKKLVSNGSLFVPATEGRRRPLILVSINTEMYKYKYRTPRESKRHFLQTWEFSIREKTILVYLLWFLNRMCVGVD